MSRCRTLAQADNDGDFLAGNACFHVGGHAICFRHGIKQGIILCQ